MAEAVKVFSTELGKTWRPRRDAADAAHQRASAKWDYYRALYLSVYDLTDRVGTWNDKVAIGWAAINAMIDDTYFQNPETLLLPRFPDPTGDMTKEINDVTDTVHKDADTEGIVRQGMQACGFAGFGLHWAFHEQVDHDEPEYSDAPDPATPPIETGTKAVADRQYVCGDYVSPWDFRGDPSGRRWDFRDFAWITRKFRPFVGDVLKWPTVKNAAMFQEWAKGQRQQLQQPNDQATRIEEDEDYLQVELEETWDLRKRRILIFPVGADFEVHDEPMPIEFVDAKETAATLIAFNRVPENKQHTEGFWPKPDIELIADQLEELNRLNGLLMQAATLSSLKYIYMQGLISEEEWKKLSATDSLIGIPVDLTKVKEQLQAMGMLQMSGEIDIRKLLMLLPQEERAAMIKHGEAIERVLNNIAEVLGQGPNARYGIAPSKTATEAAGIQQAKDQRARSRANMAGRIYDAITAKFWLLLKAHQDLPIDYIYSTDGKAGAWRQFHVAKVRNINFMYRHRAGSSRPRDRQGELLAQREMASIALPFLGSAGQFDAGLEILKEMYTLYGLKNLTIFNRTAVQIATQLAMLRHKVMSDGTGQMGADPQVSHDTSELISELLTAVLGQKGMMQVAQQLQAGQGPQQQDGGGGGMGSPAAVPTPGEEAARRGSAGAGMSPVTAGG